jgi:hypothetical protein
MSKKRKISNSHIELQLPVQIRWLKIPILSHDLTDEQINIILTACAIRVNELVSEIYDHRYTVIDEVIE